MSVHGQPVTGDALSRAIAFSHGVLPDQGPIGVFVHHNTLHAFQHLPFHEAVQAGAAVAGARPYRSADEFRDAYARGRITADDVESVLQDELGEQASTLSIFDAPRVDIWRALMVDSTPPASQAMGVAGAPTTRRNGVRRLACLATMARSCCAI